MHVEELLSRYADGHDLNRGTLVWFNCAIARWARHLEHLPVAEDFNDRAFNAWLTAEVTGGQISRQTVSSYRRAILMLWRWGWREGHLASPPKNPKVIKAPLPVPTGTSAADVDRLLSAAAKLTGEFRRSKISKAAYYRALVLLVWDSGLRLSDALRVTWAELERGCVVQKKTGWPKYFRLREPTRKALEAARIKGEPRALGAAVSRRHALVGMKRLREAAELSVGGTKAIRKGAASAVERDHPGQAGRFLGHRTQGLAERHYIDPNIAGREPPMPPPLAG